MFSTARLLAGDALPLRACRQRLSEMLGSQARLASSTANSNTSVSPAGGAKGSPNSSKDNPPPQSPPQQSMHLSPEVPQHEAADKIPNQVPNRIGGGRYPDALEADTTVSDTPEKALPKEKAS